MASAKLSEPTVYRNWALSLLPDPKPPQVNLLEDSKELLLLQVFEALRPGVLDWRRIDQKPSNYYKKLSNLTLLFEAMRDEGIVVLSVRPADILEGKLSALFAVLWNFMRVYYQERVSKTKEVDESALVEWANNFKSPVWHLAMDQPDEVICGSDKDFFYGHSIDEGSGVLGVILWEVPVAKAVCRIFEEAPELMGGFEISQPTEFGSVTRGDGCVAPLNKKEKNPEPDIFEMVDINFLSHDDRIPAPRDEQKARQSLINISNLFGNLPSKTDQTKAAEAPVPSLPAPDPPKEVILPTDPDPEEGQSLVGQVLRRLADRGKLRPDWAARIATKSKLDKQIKNFITKNRPKELEEPEASPDFDLTSLLSQVKAETSSQLLTGRAKALAQSSEIPAALQRLSVHFRRPVEPTPYPPDFPFNQDYRKVLYRVLKNEFTSSTPIADLRAMALAQFNSSRADSSPQHD